MTLQARGAGVVVTPIAQPARAVLATLTIGKCCQHCMQIGAMPVTKHLAWIENSPAAH